MAVHESVNGLRIGAFAGGLLGAVLAAVIDPSIAWLIFVFGFIGGVVGYRLERRR
ncbi:MAG: hypothetical protein KJO18_06305 [Acidimicrobiia bacterium]|nr:hypothetical protein [Acidimicrobiia bacterium]